jgi:hypothetical protein
MITIVFRPVLARPHRRPPSNQTASLESQPTQPIQQVLGRTLRQFTVFLQQLQLVLPTVS